MSDQIAHKASVAITVEWILKQAGALQTGKSGTTTATVFDEVDGSFSTPAVTEPITGIYRCSFTPDTAGLWHVKIVETSLPEAIVMSYRVVAVVDSEELDDIQARLPAALVSGRMDSSVGAMAANVITAASTAADYLAEINTEVDTALADIRLDEVIQNAASPATPTINSFWDRITSKDGSQTYDRATDSLEAIKDSIAGGGLTAQQVRDAMKLAPTVGAPSAGSVDEHLDDILADTAAIQPTVATNLDATVSSRATPAQVNTEVDTALADIRLDELIQNAAAPADPTADSFIDLITSKDAGQTFDRSTDSLEAIRDSAAGAGLTAQQVRDAMKLTPSVGAPAAGSVDEHLDDILADTAAMQPLIDVATSTRATPAQVNTEVDTALVDIRLDELIQNAAAPATPTIDSFVDRMTSKNGAQTYDRSTDSLEAIVDGGGAGLTQQQVADALLLAPAGVPAAGSVYSEFDVLMGPGFNPATDSLEEIRDEVDACCGTGGNGADVINVEGI